MKKITFFSVLLVSLLLISCQSDENIFGEKESNPEEQDVVYLNMDLEPVSVAYIDPKARTKNTSPYRVIMYSAEYITATASGKAGKTVIFADKGNKQLDFDFSPFASLDETSDISYYVDQMRPSSTLPLPQTDAAIERAANTWENVGCSDMGLNRMANVPVAIGIVAESFGFPSAAGYVADVNHCGWMPASFFDMVAPDGSASILGVTFTFLLTDEDGEFIDTNQDGKFDVALREIYYNDAFTWSDGSDYDVETIALHEMGHGLSQAHFGKAFYKKKGQVQFAPRAVMNAVYSGVQTAISGTDQGGHCSIWANWPNK